MEKLVGLILVMYLIYLAPTTARNEELARDLFAVFSDGLFVKNHYPSGMDSVILSREIGTRSIAIIRNAIWDLVTPAHPSKRLEIDI